MSMRWAAALMAASMVGLAAAQAPADNAEQKARLIEQKIRLVEMLIKSPAARSVPYGRDAESGTLVEHGQKAVDAARQALAEQRFDDATKLLDEALKAASSASRKLSPDSGGLSESAQRKSLQDMEEQVAMYRASVVDLSRDPAVGAGAIALLARIDALSSESKQLAGGGRLGDANRKMAEAYKVAVEEISRLRAGQEVVLSLSFETPADEFAYEQKRFGSNEILVEMMIDEGRAEGDRRRLVDGFVDEGRRLKRQADDAAAVGRYEDAVALMEKASGQLNRALQSMGVPVF